MTTIPGIVRIGTSSAGAATNPIGNMTTHQPNPSEITKTKEYYVKVPKSKKTFHALKFNNQVIDFSTIGKAEMVRDTTNQPPQRQDWDSQPKQGEGSEYNKEAKESHRLKRLGFVSKRGAVDLPWIVRGVDKEKSKERQFIGKKSITENSSYFIFIKCPDGGGFEAHPLEDWYTFAPYKTYKALNAEEAEEEFKRRHKTLNKLMIMANKRKNEVEGGANDLEDEEIDQGKKKESSASKTTSLISAMYQRESPTKAGSSRNKKASRLSDDEDDFDSRKVKKPVVVKKKKKQEDDEEGEDAVQEDSDDGDHEGREKDYDSTDEESEEEPDTEKYEEKYGQKGVDEEEAIKSLEKETDDEEEDKKTDEDDDDEDLTEQGKEYKKLMSKNDDENGDELDEFIKTGKMGGDDSKESSSSFDEADLDDDKPGKGSKGKKRKAGDGLSGGPQIKSSKKSLSGSRGMQPGNLQNHDESSSSSTSSQTGKAMMTKSSKTAAIIASVNRQKQQQGSNTSMSESRQTPGTSSQSARSIASVVSEEEVRKYLSRKLMTAKELLKKFRAKTQNAFSDQELCDRLKIILDKMNVQFKTVDNKNYLALP